MSLSSGEVILLALIDVMTNKHLDDARERMRENIDADLSDIAKAVNLERIGAEKRCRENILCTWFIGGLFSYDYHLARRALVKCIALIHAGRLHQSRHKNCCQYYGVVVSSYLRMISALS